VGETRLDVSSFFKRDRAWQAYSNKQWQRIMRNCQSGLMEIRADLRWFHEMFLAPAEVQADMFYKSYLEVRAKLVPYMVARTLCLVVALPFGIYGAYQYSHLFIADLNYCYGIAALAGLVAIVVFVNHIKHVYYDPKGLPLISVFVLFFIIATLLFLQTPCLLVGIFIYILSLLCSNVEMWVLRNKLVGLLAEDYTLFRETSGRPNDSSERPPLCVLQPKGDEFSVMAWDENPKPELPDSSGTVLNTVIIGRRFDAVLPKISTQFLALVTAVGLGLNFNFDLSEMNGLMQDIWILLLVSLGLTVFTSYVCPSHYYAQYISKVENEKRRSVDEKSSAMIHLNWILVNTLWTALCLAVWSTLSCWLRAILMGNSAG
jgi:hypothetical protein